MHKVTSVNLNGRAYQLEQTAYDVLQEYLAQAQKSLAGDPDREEVMQDFEQAIAEKCNQILTAHKNVVTGTEMKTIITAMGPVETPDDKASNDDASEAVPKRVPKRLYVLREGDVIGGVCNGLAAYLNVDVTVVRVLFVILAFATSGFWILVYVIMLAILPEAKTPEQKAELRGERFTAQDLLDRAKKKYSEVSEGKSWEKVAQGTSPALTNTGNALLQVLRGTATVFVIVASILFGLLTATWATLVWMVLLGNIQLHDQLSTISHWTIAAGVTAIYILLLIPLWLTGYALRRFAKKSDAKTSTPLLLIAITAGTIAFATLTCVVAVTSGRVADYQRTHGYVHMPGSGDADRICINSDICGREDLQTRPQYYR